MENGHDEVAKALLERGADATVKDPNVRHTSPPRNRNTRTPHARATKA